jgi:hypothetical protein
MKSKSGYNPWWNTNLPFWRLEKSPPDAFLNWPVSWRVTSRIGNMTGPPMFTRRSAVWQWFLTCILWRYNVPLFKIYKNQGGWRAYSILKQKGHYGPWGKSRRAALWQWLKMPFKR